MKRYLYLSVLLIFISCKQKQIASNESDEKKQVQTDTVATDKPTENKRRIIENSEIRMGQPVAPKAIVPKENSTATPDGSRPR